MRLDILIRRALRNASPVEAERRRKALREGQVAEVLPELVKLAEREGPLGIYYVSKDRSRRWRSGRRSWARSRRRLQKTA